MNDGLKSPYKCVVNITALICGQNNHPVKCFDALKQVGHFLIGIFVVSIADVGAFPEKGIGLIKKEDPVFIFGLVKQAGKILLGFADVF